MVTSYLSPADVAEITDAMRDMWATQAAMAGGETQVVLSRWSDAQQNWISLPAQGVVVTYAVRQERVSSDESAESVTVDGWLTGLMPFDVERGDRFALGAIGDEERGEVVTVRPPRLGTQRAGFRLTLGEL